MKKKTTIVPPKKKKRRAYYSISWRVNGRPLTTSGPLTEVASMAVQMMGRGADTVTITRCLPDE